MAKQDKQDKLEKHDFDLFQALDAIDKKQYDYYDSLTAEQQKKFSPYMLTMWTSLVNNKNNNITSYYVMNTEYSANKHMLNDVISNHASLQWMMLCAASPGVGKQFRQWLPTLSADIVSLKREAKIKEISEYFKKTERNISDTQAGEMAEIFVDNQKYLYRLSKLCPTLKIQDIEVLSKLVTPEQVKDYEAQHGNV